MATYEERLASFEPKKQKSSKRTAVNASLAKGWPHPSSFRATPSSLAHAGFYFDPTADKNDNVTCFMCEHSLGAWTAPDDPFTEHLNVDPKCCWAVSRCNIELDRQKDGSFVFTVAARLPTAKAMEKARADTFKGFWIHDQTKGHTANSRKMAKAGWIFNPGLGDDSDIATCFYCGKHLDGWEEGDDPTHEHRTRVPNCPVFTGKVTAEQRSAPVEDVITSSTGTKPAPPPSKTSSTRSKPTTKRDKAPPTTTSEHHDTATESDAPSQPKRGRSKKSAAPSALLQAETAPPVSQASIASSSKPTIPKESKPTRSKSSRSTSVSRVIVDDPPEPMEVPREPSPDLKPKKGKAAKKSGKVTANAKANNGRASPSNSVDMSESNASVSVQEDEDDVPTKTTGKKKAPKKKSKKSKAPSVKVDEDETMDVEPEPVLDDPDVTPMPPSRVTMDSLGGWESFQAANLELEELARELHIEGEFAAIGKPSASSKQGGRPITSGAATLKPPSKQRVLQAEEKTQPGLWDWREREKSVGAKSVVTEMTEEEEVEKSLAGDLDDDEEEEQDDVDPIPSPPRSRAPSTVSRAQSTAASTTVSSKTKAKVREIKGSDKSRGAPADTRVHVLQDEEMADGETPKASRSKGTGTAGRAGSTLPSRAPLVFPTASFDSDMNGSNPFLVARNLGGGGGGGGSRSGIDSLMAQLDAPLISRDVDSRALTEAEREMTLEEWIQYDVEMRKELIRKEGRKWIETFLESAEGMRERIRAM